MANTWGVTAGAETHRVRLGYGWKTGPTRGPRLEEKRSAGPLCQSLQRGGGRARRQLGCAAWAESRALGRAGKKEGGGESRPLGKRRNGPSPRVGRERGKSFPFSKFIFC